MREEKCTVPKVLRNLTFPIRTVFEKLFDSMFYGFEWVGVKMRSNFFEFSLTKF